MQKIWSVHEHPGLKPACSSLSLLSIAVRILCKIIEQNTFPGTDNNVIPRQLLQLVKSPFFGIFIIAPFFQSFGIFSWVHLSL